MSGAAQITSQLQNLSPDAGRSEITRAIESAAANSHTPFATLVAIAGAESGFHADARSVRSSAAGPFQITEATWLHLVKTYGAAAGRPDLAALVHQDAGGRLSVAEGDRAAVLGARHDIDLSSRLAARFCDECRSGLAKKLGRPPTEEDVRLAYFLGVNGATRLMTAASASPGETVRALLPRAYANHRGMFSQHGHPLSAGEALTALESRFSTQIAQGDALKSYAGARALADHAMPPAPGDAAEALAAADNAAAVYTAAADAATAPSSVVVAAGTGAIDTAAADATEGVPQPGTPAGSAAPTQLAAADAKPLACKPTSNGGVNCAL